MLNCRDLTRLVSESFERKLTLGERMNLWFHISMCRTCRHFRRLQFRIHDAVRQYNPADAVLASDDDELLPERSRIRMQQAVLSASKGKDSPTDNSPEE